MRRLPAALLVIVASASPAAAQRLVFQLRAREVHDGTQTLDLRRGAAALQITTPLRTSSGVGTFTTPDRAAAAEVVRAFSESLGAKAPRGVAGEQVPLRCGLDVRDEGARIRIYPGGVALQLSIDKAAKSATFSWAKSIRRDPATCERVLRALAFLRDGVVPRVPAPANERLRPRPLSPAG